MCKRKALLFACVVVPNNYRNTSCTGWLDRSVKLRLMEGNTQSWIVACFYSCNSKYRLNRNRNRRESKEVLNFIIYTNLKQPELM